MIPAMKEQLLHLKLHEHQRVPTNPASPPSSKLQMLRVTGDLLEAETYQ